MTTQIAPLYDSSWTTTSINSSAIADAGTDTTGIISNDTKGGALVSVEIAYGSPASEGVKVYVFGDVDGTNYEAVADGPWGFQMSNTASTTHRKTFQVFGRDYDDFKVHLTNDTGASVTATVRYKQFAQTVSVV